MNATGMPSNEILATFPILRKSIMDLYVQDGDFRELCDHFAECRDVLERLRGEQTARTAHIEEYEILTNELKQEIRKTIDATL